jgi:hypothetical protein
MAKKEKPKPPVPFVYHTDDDELNRRFYQRFDENFVFNKALALACILEDQEKFKLLTAEYQDIDSSRINDKFFETLRAELHFTEMHQFEGFFALLIAIFKGLPHWIYLTTYHTSQIADAIHQFIEKDIKTLTGEIAKNDREFVSMAVYATYEPQEGSFKEQWGENLDNIAWLIRHMAERYMESKAEYNSYKHGLRVMTGESSFGKALNGPDGTPVGPSRIIAYSEDAFGYLEFEEGVVQTIQHPTTQQTTKVFKPKKEKDDDEDERPKEQAKEPDVIVINEVAVNKVYEVSKFFNPKQSLVYLDLMNRLLKTIKNTRLAFYTDGGELGPLMTLFNLDKDEIVSLRENNFVWRTSI